MVVLVMETREEARRGGGLAERLPGVSEGEEDGSASALPPPQRNSTGGQLFVLERKKEKLPTTLDSNRR